MIFVWLFMYMWFLFSFFMCQTITTFSHQSSIYVFTIKKTTTMELHAYNYNLSSLQDVTNNSPCSDLWNWDCNTRFILYGHCFYLMWWAWRDPLMWLETQESEFLFINRAKIKKKRITSPSIYRLLHPHLFTGYYTPIYLPVITSPSIYRLLYRYISLNTTYLSRVVI